MKLRTPKFFIKLMIISVFVGIIPIVSFGSYFHYYFSDHIQRKVDQSKFQLLSETVLRIEQLFTTIDYSLTLVANSNLLQNAFELNYASTHFQTFNALSVQLRRLQSLDMGIDNVFFVNLTHNWVIENRGVTLLDQHLMYTQLLDFMDNERSSFWTAAEATVQAKIAESAVDAQGLPFIFLVKKTPLNAPVPTGLLVVQIPRFELEKRVNLSGVDHVQLIMDKDFNILVDGGSTLLSDDQLPAGFRESVKAAVNDTGEAKIQINSQYYAMVRQSSYNGWYYFSIYSLEEITKDATQIRKVTYLLSFVILILTLILSIMMNRRAYRPIRRLYEKVALQSGSDKKSYDEFQFIGERIESLIDTSGHMNRQIVGQVEKLRELYVFKLLIGETDPAESEQRMTYYGMNTKAKHIAVIAIQISNWGQSRYKDSDLDIMMFAVSNVISEMIPADQRIDPVIIGSYHATIVSGNQESEQEFRSYLTSLADLIQEAIKKYLELNINIGVSRSHTHMGKLSLAYNEALEALKSRNLLDRESLLFHEDLFSDKNPLFVYPKKVEKDLILAVHESNMPKAKETLRRISHYLLDQNIKFRECQLYLVRLLVNLITDSLHPGEALQLLQKNNKSVFEQLFELNAMEEIEAWFEACVLQPLIQYRLGGLKPQPYMNIAESMIAIIHEQYKTDLTLETCADQLKFNPDYLRRVFRKGIGMNFSEYLAQYRFEASKQLLEHTELTIADIAQQLNYNNPQNFIRYFKKMMGMTPGQYRENMK
ncbi:helix-turn-helix domain-containing protein [Paenibacillus eucommiae]|uniref:AraC-like DNA-binding protein n=1 Tax=Paenibacillus eucommiae TaxID=1355755 RepID=A0ABS4IVU0_9BACL|nr:helix-turn-helix domain-containing protein [Paenibacillus eucommiae]MBP1991704.1 AraC-like DNA-binding protein [Paenibacillus eucommiae]